MLAERSEALAGARSAEASLAALILSMYQGQFSLARRASHPEIQASGQHERGKREAKKRGRGHHDSERMYLDDIGICFYRGINLKARNALPEMYRQQINLSHVLATTGTLKANSLYTQSFVVVVSNSLTL